MQDNFETHSPFLPVALSIAGSDSGAGAGIQADIKTMAAHGVFAVTALTLVTAQSTSTVDLVYPLPALLVRSQLDCLYRDFNIAAVKTGALGSPAVVAEVARFARASPAIPCVVDPVIVSKHGYQLADAETISAIRETLLPCAALLTPNLHETQTLLGCAELLTRAEIEAAAGALLQLGCGAVVIKGGHRTEDAADYFASAFESFWIEGPRVESPHSHGTGCTFSSAVAANLVLGRALPEAVRSAKSFVTGALEHGRNFGRGINPVNHFWQTQPQFGRIEAKGGG
jgi:hydroxymethylpyrimidine/phosphomethylpyrimidine kinase